MTRISILGYEPNHLSFSTYDGYATCGQRAYLQKVMRVEQRPNWGSVGGTAVHGCVEVIETAGGEVTDLTGLFNDQFDQALADTLERSPSYSKTDFHVAGRGKKTEEWWREEGPRMVARWIDWRNQTGWSLWHTPQGLPGVETELNFTIGDDIPVRAFIDSVFLLPSGLPAIVDVKTGRLPETGAQLGLYRLGMEKQFDVDVPWGYFWDAAKGDHGQPISLDRYTEHYFVTLFEQAIAGHNAGVFLPKPANNCGGWCGVAKFCPAVGGSQAHTVPQPGQVDTLGVSPTTGDTARG